MEPEAFRAPSCVFAVLINGEWAKKKPRGSGAFWWLGGGLGHAAAEGHTGHAKGQQRQRRRLGEEL